MIRLIWCSEKICFAWSGTHASTIPLLPHLSSSPIPSASFRYYYTLQVYRKKKRLNWLPLPSSTVYLKLKMRQVVFTIIDAYIQYIRNRKNKYSVHTRTSYHFTYLYLKCVKKLSLLWKFIMRRKKIKVLSMSFFFSLFSNSTGSTLMHTYLREAVFVYIFFAFFLHIFIFVCTQIFTLAFSLLMHDNSSLSGSKQNESRRFFSHGAVQSSKILYVFLLIFLWNLFFVSMHTVCVCKRSKV